MQTRRPTNLASPPIALALAALFAPPALAQGANGLTEILTIGPGGTSLGQPSNSPSVSADGRYVSFTSREPFDPADVNGESDVYVLDRQTGTIVCASATAGGIVGNQDSFASQISGDGRWVAFMSAATNLVPLDGNAAPDVFVKDLQTGALTRASNAHLSPAAGNGESVNPAISDDGRYVAFQSSASDLVPGDTNGTSDVFRRDLQTGTIERVSEGVWGQSNGASGAPSISGDGSVIAFSSSASNLVLFDNNGKQDVFVVAPGSNPALVSKGLFGAASNGHSNQVHLDGDGSHVTFLSGATNLVLSDFNGSADIFVVELATSTVERASLTSDQLELVGTSVTPRLARNGRYVAFVSNATFAPFDSPGHFDVFVRDLVLDRTWTASRPTGTTAFANGHSSAPSLSADGSLIAWFTDAPDMVPGDTNDRNDVFLRIQHPDPNSYCTASTTAAGCQPVLTASGYPSVTTGDFFTFQGDDLPNWKQGILFYGFQGRALIPFQGNTLCVAPPLARTPLIATNGNPPPADDCTGFFAFDMNGFALGLAGGNPRPELTDVGQVVDVQFWGRDGVSSTFLSSALEYVVGP